MKSYKHLVAAIVVRAIVDYKKALIQLEENPNYEVAIIAKKEIEDFFKSDWFSFICEINMDLKRFIEKENLFNDN